MAQPLVRFLAPGLRASALEDESLAPPGSFATGRVTTPFGEQGIAGDFDPGAFLLEARADASKAGVVTANDNRVVQEQVRAIDESARTIESAMRQLVALQPPQRRGWGARLSRAMDPYAESAERFAFEKLKLQSLHELGSSLAQLYQERRLLVEPTPFEKKLEDEAADLTAKAALREQREMEMQRLMGLGLKLTPQQRLKFRESGTFEEGPSITSRVEAAARLGEAGVAPPLTGDPEADAIMQQAALDALLTKERRRKEDIQAQVQNRYIPGPFEGFQTKQQLLGAIEEETEKRFKDVGNIQYEARPVTEPGGKPQTKPAGGGLAGALTLPREPVTQRVPVPIRDRDAIRSEVIKELFPGAVEWFPQYVQQDVTPPPPPPSPAGAERTKKKGEGG